jgi:hypothetical protein
MRRFLVILLALAILPVLSFAQVKGGDIYGTVVLADGSKIPGVLVTITGEKLGKQTTVSSEKGNFRFLDLPPGIYELKFELEGFKTIIRKDVELRLGATVTLNILMETTTLKEEVTVTEKVTAIDTRRTDVAVNVTKEMVNSLPTARNPWTLLSTLPGIQVDRIDIGGADSGQQSNFLAGGGDSDDTTWAVDGATITDPSAIGSAPAYLNSNAYDEVQVTMGASDISAMTGGIQLNFVSKAAGNKLSGDFHLYVEQDVWQLDQDPTPYMVQNGLVVPGINRLYMYGINLGGPIIKDKLWWFGSWAIQDIHKRTEAGTEDATWLVSGYGKLNFQVGSTSGDFHISYDDKQKWGRTNLGPGSQNNGSLWDQLTPGYLYYGGLSHTFGNLMLNAKVVYTDGGFSLDPRGAEFTVGEDRWALTGADMIFVVTPTTRMEDSAWGLKTDRNSLNLSLDGNYFLEGALGGDHEIKFGVDYYSADTLSLWVAPNQRIAYVYRDAPQYNYLKIESDYITDVNFKRVSGYVQDTITWGKLTANIGVRYDKEQGKVNPGTAPAFYWYEPGSPHHGEQMFADIIPAIEIPSGGFKPDASWSLISPRVSMSYDITGDGKNVVKLSAARYMSQSGNNIAGNYIPYRYAYAAWTDANGDENPQYYEVGDLTWYDPYLQVNNVTGLNNIQYASDYNTPLLDELVLTFEKALTEDISVSLTGFLKKKSQIHHGPDSRGRIREYTKGLMADGSTETQANYEVIPYQVGGTTVNVYSQIEAPIGLLYYNLPNSYLMYKAIQVEINKKLSNKWMANLNFTYQDWKHHLDPNDLVDLTNFDFYNGGDVAPNTEGSGLTDIFLGSDWMFKFTGMYQLPYGITASAFFQAKQGGPQPLRRRGRFGQGSLYIYRDGYKLGDERLPTLWMLHLGLEKAFKVGEAVTATLVLDWYNVTNNQIELKYDIAIGADTPGAERPIMWTGPGVFQFGVRVNF